MISINDIILELSTNLFSRPSKAQRDMNLPWNIAAPNSNYNPHLNVRPVTTEVNKFQQQQNLAANPNKQPIQTRTANFIKGINLPINQSNTNRSLGINSSSLLPQTGVTSLHQQVSNNVSGLKVPPSARYINWKNMSPSQIS